MAFDYIRRQYNVPARRGQRVLYKGKPGVIVGCYQAYIKVRLDGETRAGVYHPTWQIVYVES